MGGLGLCKCSVFYTCDRSTDTITEQKVKVQVRHVYAHAQYKLLARDGKIKINLRSRMDSKKEKGCLMKVCLHS